MTTKYNIGDEVWIMYQNIPTKVYVYEINIHNDKSIYYSLNVRKDRNLFSIDEILIYPTKRELLNSFLSEEDKL